jgi:hypothetical protein
MGRKIHVSGQVIRCEEYELAMAPWNVELIVK